MSVTFSVGGDPQILGYTTTCYAYGCESDWRGPTHPTREAALAAHLAEHAGNPDCDGEYASPVYQHDEFDVNMSNVNAATLMSVLGIGQDDEDGLCGSLDCTDFLGRVLLAIALAPQDEGVPAHEITPAEAAADPLLSALGLGSETTAGPRVINGGRPVGYIQTRLMHLHDLAEAAVAAGQPVTWG